MSGFFQFAAAVQIMTLKKKFPWTAAGLTVTITWGLLAFAVWWYWG